MKKLIIGFGIAIFFVGYVTTDRSEATAACDRVAAQRELQSAREQLYRKAFATAKSSARNAAIVYEGCATGEASPGYELDLEQWANALVVAAQADAHRRARPQEIDEVSRARSALAFLAHDDTLADGATVGRAAAALATIDRVFPPPALRPTRLPPRGIVARPMPTSEPPAAVAVLWSYPEKPWWITSIDRETYYLHVRVHVRAVRAVNFVGNDVSMTISSPSGGRETVVALNQQAPHVKRQVLKMNSSGSTLFSPADVDQPVVMPAEDLGALGNLSLQAGQERSFVVTFRIRPDADVTKDVLDSIVLRRPQF